MLRCYFRQAMWMNAGFLLGFLLMWWLGFKLDDARLANLLENIIWSHFWMAWGFFGACAIDRTKKNEPVQPRFRGYD